MAGPLISFLTDFGPESAPAVCRGVMWGIAPDARILDLSHTVRKYALRDGAFLLIEQVGPAIDGSDLVDLILLEPVVGDGWLDTVVLFIDSCGNVRLSGQPADLAKATAGELVDGRLFRVTGGSNDPEGGSIAWHPTFGAVPAGQPLLYEDADHGGLGIALNQASAAERSGLDIDTPVRIEPVDG